MINKNRKLDIWQRRAASMLATIESGGKEFFASKGEGPPLPRRATLANLRDCLHAFAKSQLQFFINGFLGESNVRLEPSRQYPIEYVLRCTLDQVAYDMGAIELAAGQRLYGLGNKQIRESLNKADVLACRALKPAIDQGLLPNATVVTYYHKSVQVRIIPYAPAVLIGIPFSAVSLPRDLLAIPHEVGHYVYRYGILQGDTYERGRFEGSRFSSILSNRLSGQPQWCRNWLEEIFADVYGTLIGGPAIALNFQDILVDSKLEDFAYDDGRHPVSALRPHIYINVLKRLKYFENAAQKLEGNWDYWFKERGAPVVFSPNYANSLTDEPINLKTASRDLDELVISQILNHHLDTLLSNGHGPQHMWSRELGSNEDIESAYEDFEAYVDEISIAPNDFGFDAFINEEVPELRQEDGDVWLQSADGRVDEATRRKVGNTNLWIDSVKDAAQRKGGARFNMPPEAWRVLFDTSGWASEGPESDPLEKEEDIRFQRS